MGAAAVQPACSNDEASVQHRWAPFWRLSHPCCTLAATLPHPCWRVQQGFTWEQYGCSKTHSLLQTWCTRAMP